MQKLVYAPTSGFLNPVKFGLPLTAATGLFIMCSVVLEAGLGEGWRQYLQPQTMTVTALPAPKRRRLR